MAVEVHLLHQSQPVVRGNVQNTYVKAGLFCLLIKCGRVEKYPIIHIFRVVETQEVG